MPANLSPEYKEAQAAFRRASDPKERLDRLREMLRSIPKHKGTEHLQADIKTRIKELTAELAGPKKGGARGGPALVVPHEGAGQVALLGPPNAGKSRLHALLTGSHAVVGPYPFTTRYPQPGMLPYEDVLFQLVDLPPIAADVMEPWLPNTLQQADAALLVVDLQDPECVQQVDVLRERLQGKRVTLAGGRRSPRVEDDDPFRTYLPTLLLANKCDLLGDPRGELDVFASLVGIDWKALAVSAETGAGCDVIGAELFEMLGVLRVYTKLPGQPPTQGTPFTLLGSGTVRDVAQLVHRGRAMDLKFARLWGSGEFDGQQVSGDHPVRDGNIVELHW